MKTSILSVTVCLVAAMAFMTAPANAARVLNQSNQISLSVFVPCAAGGAGEMVDLSGPLHTLITLTINGDNFSEVMHFQPQGISGTGETTGAKYQATGVTEETTTGSFQNGHFNQTFVNRFDIIGQGPGNNFTIHETAHITINANGTVTVFFDNFGVECK
jgi:hypothetical protein